MALAKTITGITDIKGSISGSTYSRDKSGLHIKAKTKNRKYTRSGSQQDQINAFCKVRGYISENCNDEIKEKWHLYAQNHPIKNRIGETIILTWYNAFLLINVPRCRNGLEVVTEPPE